MDKLQRQIMELNYKVNRLSQIVERISKHISISDDEVSENRESTANNHSPVASIDKIVDNQLADDCTDKTIVNSIPLLVRHKDIIDDEESNHLEGYDYSGSQSEQDMSCELQVQRLTAQLTAAYHRIAALEEQLLAKRQKM